MVTFLLTLVLLALVVAMEEWVHRRNRPRRAEW
jgi:hypothetical protein